MKKIHVPGNSLDIYKEDEFLSSEECNALLKIIKGNLSPSAIHTPERAQSVASPLRTSSTCHFKHLNPKLIEYLPPRISEALPQARGRMETIQAQHYEPGELFAPHMDTFKPGTPLYEGKAQDRGGQRMWTFMIILQAPTLGGETKFSNLKTPGSPVVFRIHPVQGRAVAWNNLLPDGETNPYSLHEGCPVEEGDKTIITTWFREE